MPRPLVEMIAALGGIAAVTVLYSAVLGVTNATTAALTLILVVLLVAAMSGLGVAVLTGRVMVCMSSNALAPRVIRTGARIAGRLGARWYAVYVETPRERPDRMTPAGLDAILQNTRLAETLGRRWSR